MNEDDLIRSNVDFFVTETLVEGNILKPEIYAILRRRKTTGKIEIHLSEGGLQKSVLTEKTRTTQAEAEKIRSLMWNGQNKS